MPPACPRSCRARSTPRPAAGPGPVVVGLPEDMLTERVDGAERARLRAGRDLARSAGNGGTRAAAVGGGTARSSSSAAAAGRRRRAPRLRDSPNASHLPVATSYRRLPLFDPLHRCYAGDLGLGPNPKLIARVKAADLVMVVGGRLGEIPSQGYTLFDIPRPQTKLVHVHPGAEELGRVYRPDLAIHAAPTAFAQAAEALRPPKQIELARANATGARRLPRLDGRADRPARRRQSRRRHGVAARKPAHRHHPVQRRGQLRRLDPSLLPFPPLCHAHRADFGLDGLWQCRRRSR